MLLVPRGAHENFPHPCLPPRPRVQKKSFHEEFFPVGPRRLLIYNKILYIKAIPVIFLRRLKKGTRMCTRTRINDIIYKIMGRIKCKCVRGWLRLDIEMPANNIITINIHVNKF